MSKVKTIALERGQCDRTTAELKYTTFIVKRVTDTTDFFVGQEIKKSEADELCASKEWKVSFI